MSRLGILAQEAIRGTARFVLERNPRIKRLDVQGRRTLADTWADRAMQNSMAADNERTLRGAIRRTVASNLLAIASDAIDPDFDS